MKEKRKQGNEEPKQFFFGCILALLISFSIAILCLFGIAWTISEHVRVEAQLLADEIEPIIQGTCNLPEYEVDERFFGGRNISYYHPIESKNLVIYCYPTNESWQCTCTEPQ